MRPLPTLADPWLVGYSLFFIHWELWSCPHYKRYTILFFYLLDSDETLADSIWLLAIELTILLVSSPAGVATEFFLQTATCVPQPGGIYHSIRLVCLILIKHLRTLADTWLVTYFSFPFTDSYSHAPTTSHIPFDSSRRLESKKTLADSIRPLVVQLPLV